MENTILESEYNQVSDFVNAHRLAAGGTISRGIEQIARTSRAEHGAYYARRYGLTRDELRYIPDPKDVYGDDFPGETFRVLKDKEMKQYGEYRTRRLVLEKWDEMARKSR